MSPFQGEGRRFESGLPLSLPKYTKMTLSKHKSIATGILIGIALGLFVTFLNPRLMNVGLEFNQTTNEQLGYSTNHYSIKSGSVYNSLMLIPLIAGFLGGSVGFVVFKHNDRKR